MTRAISNRSSVREITPIDVVAHDRAYDAHQLRLGGVDWPEVAARTGYLDGRIAAMAVNAYLQKTAAEQAPDHRRQMLQLELARLDALQAAFWPAAMAGDLLAANYILTLIGRRCMIFGFNRADDDLTGAAVAIIGGTTQEYIAGLRAAVAAVEQSGGI